MTSVVTVNVPQTTVAVEDPATLVEVTQVEVEVTVGTTGPQGPPGPAAPEADQTWTAAASVGGHKAVRTDAAGQLRYASSADPAGLDATIGVTTGAIAAGDSGPVRTRGTLTHAGWTWTPAAPIYVGVDGALTHTPPATGAVLQIAVARTATEIFIAIQTPIRR